MQITEIPSSWSPFTEIWKLNGKPFIPVSQTNVCFKYGDSAPFAFYVSYFWNASRKCAISWFHASDARTPCCILLHDIFNVFEGDLNWWTRDWPQNFKVKPFLCHAVYQWKNEFPPTRLFPSPLLKQLFYLMPYYRVSLA